MTRIKPDSVEAEFMLGQGLSALGLSVPAGGVQSMLSYLQLLEKWGRTFNLSAIRGLSVMVPQHLLDSLSAAPYLKGRRVLDVGSGPGLPGLPLAIVLPQLSVTLLESRHKRVQFLLHVVAQLRLTNVDVVHQRVEQYQPAAKFDTLITRAFSSITEFVGKAEHLCARDGRMIALKGRYPRAELDAAKRSGVGTSAVHHVEVPGLAAQRHIVILNPRRG